MKIGSHSGAKTHIHGHDMYPVNFSTEAIIVMEGRQPRRNRLLYTTTHVTIATPPRTRLYFHNQSMQNNPPIRAPIIKSTMVSAFANVGVPLNMVSIISLLLSPLSFHLSQYPTTLLSADVCKTIC